eukprot:ctg_1093.g457
MLDVDPLRRVTIPEIRKHPWFVKNLPRYLALPPPLIYNRTLAVNPVLLAECARITGHTTEEIRWMLEHGKRNACTVVFEQLKDGRTRMDPSMLQPVDVGALLAAPGLASLHGAHAVGGETTSKRVKDQEMNDGHAQHALGNDGRQAPAGADDGGEPDDGDNASSGLPTLPASLISPRRFHVGVRNDYLDPKNIMEEVFRALSVLKWRAKAPSTYQVRVVTGDGTQVPGQAGAVLLNLQLYRTESHFVLDIAMIEGDVFSYVAACHALRREYHVRPGLGQRATLPSSRPTSTHTIRRLCGRYGHSAGGHTPPAAPRMATARAHAPAGVANRGESGSLRVAVGAGSPSRLPFHGRCLYGRMAPTDSCVRFGSCSDAAATSPPRASASAAVSLDAVVATPHFIADPETVPDQVPPGAGAAAGAAAGVAAGQTAGTGRGVDGGAAAAGSWRRAHATAAASVASSVRGVRGRVRQSAHRTPAASDSAPVAGRQGHGGVHSGRSGGAAGEEPRDGGRIPGRGGKEPGAGAHRDGHRRGQPVSPPQRRHSVTAAGERRGCFGQCCRSGVVAVNARAARTRKA